MYLLFKYKNMKPSDYFNLKPGEIKILRAFIHQFIEENSERTSAINNIFS